MKTPTLTPRARNHAYKGVVLIITLMIMALMTVITLTSIRGAMMEEKLAGQTRDRNKAQQAAEAALRHCLDLAINKNILLAVLTPTPPATSIWENIDWDATPFPGFTYDMPYSQNGIDNSKLTHPPRCILEQLATGSNSHLITARAVGGLSDTVVILQASITDE